MTMDMTGIRNRFCFTMMLCIAAATNASASGGITGVVVDRANGTALPSANIRVLGTPFGAASNRDGRFNLMGLRAGSYTLEASVIGYEPVRLPAQLDNAAHTLELRFELNEKAIALQDVVVTPGHFAIMREEPATQQTLTREDIQNLPQFGEDIYRAVRRLPGVASTDYSARFNVRGGSNDEVLVLLDGMELYEPFHLKDIEGGALSIIDVETIGGIQMMTGGFPAEFGNKLSGVFNVNTLKPSPERHRTSLGLSLTTARFMTEGAFANGRGQWLASARRGYLDLVMGLIEDESDFKPTYYDMLGKVEYRLNRAHTFSAHVLHAGDDLSTEDEEDGDYAQTSYGNSYGWVTLNSIFSPALYVRSLVALGRVTHDRLGADYFGSHQIKARVSDDRHLDLQVAKQDWNWEPSRRHLLKFGLDLRRLSSRYDYFNLNQSWREFDDGSVVLRADTTAVALHPSGEAIGMHVSDKMRLLEPLTLELGLRYDANTYMDERHWSPRLNAAWSVGKRTVFRLGWGEFRQTHGIHQLQVPDGETEFYPAELAEHRMLGMEHELAGGLNVRLELYDKRISNPWPRYHNYSGTIEFFPEVEEDRVRLLPGSARAHGVELFLKKDGGAKLSWWASYSYALAEDEIAGKRVPRNYDQRHTVYADVSFRPNPKWSLNAAWHFHSGWPYTEITYEKVSLNGGYLFLPRYGSVNAARYPAFHSMDIKVNRYFMTAGSRVAVFLEVTNLYNRFNVRNYWFDDERLPNGEVTLVRKADRWLPRLPSIGVRWEF